MGICLRNEVPGRPALLLAVLLLTVAVSGCSLLAAPEIEARHMLLPVNPEGVVGAARTVVSPQTVRVGRPQLPAANEGNRLVLLDGGQVTYYAGQSWDGDLADMLPSALARDLTTLLPDVAVVSEDSGLSANLELQMDVRTWATRRMASSSAVVMEADLRVVDPNSRKVLRTLPFRYTHVLPALRTEATLAAYNAGWEQLVRQAAGLTQAGLRALPGRVR